MEIVHHILEQTFCGNIKTAISGGKPQDCWKVTNTSDATQACVPKLCSQPPTTNNSNSLCESFMKGCLWNGNTAGGCQDPTTACTSYQGSQSQCETFSQSGQQCSRGFVGCISPICTDKTVPLTATTQAEKRQYCQQFKNGSGHNCQWDTGAKCSSPTNTPCGNFVSVGADIEAKQNYCQSLYYPSGPGCDYSKGDNCIAAQCSSIIPYGADVIARSLYCKSLIIKCGLAIPESGQCNAASCTDYDRTTMDLCIDIPNCIWNPISNKCGQKLSACTLYQIPDSFTSTNTKHLYCTNLSQQLLLLLTTNFICNN